MFQGRDYKGFYVKEIHLWITILESLNFELEVDYYIPRINVTHIGPISQVDRGLLKVLIVIGEQVRLCNVYHSIDNNLKQVRSSNLTFFLPRSCFQLRYFTGLNLVELTLKVPSLHIF